MSRPSCLPPRLTEQQVEAILHQGTPLLIIAGPGSGKTEVITWRVAHLAAVRRPAARRLKVEFVQASAFAWNAQRLIPLT
jgi:DNA helicase-2/ATP-dependent DNA helicase PcrA